MSNRRPGVDLAQQINDAKDGGKPVGVGTQGPPRAPPQTAPSGRVVLRARKASDEIDGTQADRIVGKIQAAYMAGIKRCYANVLKKDPGARGELQLAFTVSTTGRATNAAAKAFGDELANCVQSLMGTWRFAIPKDKRGEPTTATFALTFALVPD
jgi:hypothetical protein